MPWASAWWAVVELHEAEQKLLQPPALPEKLVVGVCGRTRFHQHPNRPEPQGVQERVGRGAARRIRRRSCSHSTLQNRTKGKSDNAAEE